MRVKLRAYLAAAAMRLGLPTDVAAGLAHVELNGFRECTLDRHTGILEYNTERIVVALTSGTLVLEGSGLTLRTMHREQLCVTGRIDTLRYQEGGCGGCGG